MFISTRVSGLLFCSDGLSHARTTHLVTPKTEVKSSGIVLRSDKSVDPGGPLGKVAAESAASILSVLSLSRDLGPLSRFSTQFYNFFH